MDQISISQISVNWVVKTEDFDVTTDGTEEDSVEGLKALKKSVGLN
jgi:hypothetical protein